MNNVVREEDVLPLKHDLPELVVSKADIRTTRGAAQLESLARRRSHGRRGGPNIHYRVYRPDQGTIEEVLRGAWTKTRN